MRITESMTYRSMLSAMQDRLQGQFEAQEALSTGLRFQHAKDDPVAAASVLRTEDLLATLESRQKNLNIVESKVGYAESRLGDLTDTLQSARDLLVRSQTVAMNTEDRSLLAEQMRGLAQDVAAIGNTRDADGRPLFGGTSASLPFAGGPGAWSLDPAISAPIQVEVSSGRSLPAGVDATTVFRDSGGTQDLASALESMAASIALSPTDDAGKLARRDALDAGLVEVDAMLERTSRARGSAGLALEAIDVIRETNEAGKLNANEELARLRDADIAEEVTKLANENASLEAARTVFQKLGQQSLFDYLR